ncbi:UxaA family hydrolase, partial [Polaribacter sp. BAL334]|uniref:UxaA family hydrolase n=1 Tax=Polaribacter sp. BAL334 TaxID=1708178 RepID=UPI0018D22488
MQKKLIKVHQSDNVAVALINLKVGENISFENQEITIISDVKAKHKIALRNFEVGEKIFMYGVLVGKASLFIPTGGVLTTENVKHQSANVSQKTGTIGWTAPNVDAWKNKTFMGYH